METIRSTIRLRTEADDIVELNALLRAAYSSLTERNLHYAAASEDVAATRRNFDGGEGWVVERNGRIVGCVLLRFPKAYPPGVRSKGPEHYSRTDVANFGRFAIEPSLQGTGIGSKLLDRIESRARELGYAELALDTAETADHLIALYERRGFRTIGSHRWSARNYRSVVMSKRLNPR